MNTEMHLLYINRNKIDNLQVVWRKWIYENRKKIIVFTVLLIMLVSLVGCGKKEKDQFTPIEEGETVAEIIIKDFGSIHVRFFDNEAPKAVENFITHAENGYYDGVSFHRIIDDFMIQGGDPTGTGRGGESIWGKSFEDEFHVKLPAL